MKRAGVTYTKNNLSRILGMVREGRTVLVTDRDTPIARIEPVDRSALTEGEPLRILVERGIATPPAEALDVEAFLSAGRAPLRPGASVVQALLDEREDRV